MLPPLSFEERVVAAAREQGVTRITLHDSGELPWSSWRERKNAGASGPDLDDAEAAVLIAAGWDYSIRPTQIADAGGSQTRGPRGRSAQP